MRYEVMKKTFLFYVIAFMSLTQSAQAMRKKDKQCPQNTSQVPEEKTASSLEGKPVQSIVQEIDITDVEKPPHHWGREVEKIMRLRMEEHNMLINFSEEKENAKKEAEEIFTTIEQSEKNMAPQTKEALQKIKEKILSWYGKEKITLHNENSKMCKAKIEHIKILEENTEKVEKLRGNNSDPKNYEGKKPEATEVIPIESKKSIQEIELNISNLLKKSLLLLEQGKYNEKEYDDLIKTIESDKNIRSETKNLCEDVIKMIKEWHDTEKNGTEEEMNEIKIEIEKIKNTTEYLKEQMDLLEKNISDWYTKAEPLRKDIIRTFTSIQETNTEIYKEINSNIKMKLFSQEDLWNIKRKNQIYLDSIREKKDFETQEERKAIFFLKGLKIKKDSPQALWEKKEVTHEEATLLKLKKELYEKRHDPAHILFVGEKFSNESLEDYRKKIEKERKEKKNILKKEKLKIIDHINNCKANIPIQKTNEENELMFKSENFFNSLKDSLGKSDNSFQDTHLKKILKYKEKTNEEIKKIIKKIKKLNKKDKMKEILNSKTSQAKIPEMEEEKE